MKKLSIIFVAVLLIVAMLFVGCKPKEEVTATATKKSDVKATEAPKEDAKPPKDSDGAFVPLEEAVSLVWAMPNNRNAPEGNEIEKHIKELVKQDLNIDLDIKLFPNDSYKEKINLTISGQEQLDYLLMPDFDTFVEYMYGGGLADITEYYNEFKPQLDWLIVSDAPTGTITAADVLAGAKMDGKLYGLGLYFNPGTHQFLFREDWMDELGFTGYSDWDTMDVDTMYDYVIAVSQGDMNGSGNAGDTVGMVNNYKDPIFTSAFDVYMGRYLERNGEMICSDVESNMRDALEFAAKLYREGAIHLDSTVMTDAQKNELVVQGKVGIYQGWWTGEWVLYKSLGMADVTPEAKWLSIGAITGTAKTGVDGVGGTGGQPLLNNVHAIPKASNVVREGVMLTAYLYNNQECYRTITYGLPDVHHTYENETITLTDAGKEMTAANWITQYRKIEHHIPNPNLPGEISPVYMKFGDEYGPHLAESSKHCRYWDLLYGIKTPASLENKGDLDTYRDEIFQNIFTGVEPIEKFDEWVQFWKDNGGPEILSEGAAEYNVRNGTSYTAKGY